MGEMADYDMEENVNSIGSIDKNTYKCGYCGKSMGSDRSKAMEHVNSCIEASVNEFKGV